MIVYQEKPQQSKEKLSKLITQFSKMLITQNQYIENISMSTSAVNI